MEDDTNKPKPLNLDELIARKMVDDITFAEYKAATSDPDHELNDPSNPRHQGFLESKKRLAESAENTAKALRAMTGSYEKIALQAHELYGASHQRFLKEPKEVRPDMWEPRVIGEARVKLPSPMPAFDVENSFLARITRSQDQLAKEQARREDREEQRHKDSTDVMLTMCMHMEKQREELENLRKNQTLESKRQEIENQRVLVLGVGTLIVALLTLAATVVAAF